MSSELRFDDLHHYVERTFRHVAESKDLDFQLRIDPRLPKSMVTDSKRLQQILKNLLSNAFKFTHSGQVTLTHRAGQSRLERRQRGAEPRRRRASPSSVTDTGIGISSEKQQIIFEAFQQADGSTSRKYGGTGLGLAISRELSQAAGRRDPAGEQPGQRLELHALPAADLHAAAACAPQPQLRRRRARAAPATAAARSGPKRASRSLAEPPPEPTLLANEAPDDRDNIQPGDTVLLIVENDLAFARFLLDAAREQGCKGLVTSQGAAALALARDYMPDAITLDIVLPDMDGWRVMDRLKHDLSTRHIPICVVSTEDARERALRGGRAAASSPSRSRPRTCSTTACRTCSPIIKRPSQARARASRRDGAESRRDRAGDRGRGPRSSSAHDAATLLGSDRSAGRRLPDRRCARPGVDLAGIARALETRPQVRRGCRCIVLDDAASRTSRACQELRRAHRAPRAFARAAGRPGRLLPASARDAAARGAAPPARGPAPVGRRPAGQEGADRRRRHPQHLRADQRARGARHDGDLGRQRPRRAAHHGCTRAPHRHRADGHHDAGDGRHRHHARGAQASRRAAICRSSPSRPRP